MTPYHRPDGQRPGTPLMRNVVLRVTFTECGHAVRWPHITDDASAPYWAAQTTPAMPGAVAPCPGCATKRRPRGDLQRVATIEVIHDEPA